MTDKAQVTEAMRAEADRIIRTARLTEFGVPINIVADLTTIVAFALAMEHQRGGISALDELNRRLS